MNSIPRRVASPGGTPNRIKSFVFMCSVLSLSLQLQRSLYFQLIHLNSFARSFSTSLLPNHAEADPIAHPPDSSLFLNFQRRKRSWPRKGIQGLHRIAAGFTLFWL